MFDQFDQLMDCFLVTSSQTELGSRSLWLGHVSLVDRSTGESVSQKEMLHHLITHHHPIGSNEAHPRNMAGPMVTYGTPTLDRSFCFDV